MGSDPFLKTLPDSQFAAFLRRGIHDGFCLGVSPLATLVSSKSNVLALAAKVNDYSGTYLFDYSNKGSPSGRPFIRSLIDAMSRLKAANHLTRLDQKCMADIAWWCAYCKTTNFSVLLILAILANGIKKLILIPANIYNQSCGRT